MKDILLLVRDDSGQPARTQAAIVVARMLGATVSCLEVDGIAQLDAAAAARGDALVEESLRHQAAVVRGEIDRVFARHGIEHRWLTAQGAVVEQLGEEAAFHDLTILTTRPIGHGRRDSSFAVAELVRATSQPLLLVPDSAFPEDFAAHATIAWDGSRPCVAAMRAAVPLLSKTRLVTMVEFGPHRDGPSIDRAVDYLRRNAISVHATHHDGVRDPADWLVSRCRAGRTSYCVMGAFSRSRGREAVFGGMTLAMLESAEVPLFVAH